MKRLLFSITFCLLVILAKSQSSPIMVCNATGTTCQPYYNIDSAYSAANTGDYIYIPGGIFIFNSTINKEVHLIGAGSVADSAMATNFTTINSNINLDLGASNTSIEGLYIVGAIMGPSNTISNIKINYCNIAYINSYLSNSSVHGCILRGTGYTDNIFYNGTNNSFTNSYIQNITNLHSSEVSNCIGISYTNNLHFVTFKNTIFATYPNSPYAQPGSNNNMFYCVYINPCPYYCLSLLNGSNNIQLSYSNLFANGIDYNDMHLIANSPGLTAGENGEEVGVFGGLFPYKEGAVPSNPHIYLKNISATTNANGQLPVQIKVRAENY